MKAKNITLDAVLFSRLLIAGIVLLIILGGVGFYYASQFLRHTALETNHAKIDAMLTDEDLGQLQRLQNELEDKQDIVDRTRQIVADSTHYQYQDQIVRDINAFAQQANVSVTGYNFESSSATTKKPGTILGVKTINATITLGSPMPYTNFLQFLKAIEQNLTKMQVTGINVTPQADNPNSVNNPSIGLIIYVRS